MEQTPGAPQPATVLVPRPLLRNLALAVLVIGIALVPATWAGEGSDRLLMSAGVALVLVLLPLWALWWGWRRRVVVHPDRVVVRRGARDVRTLAFDDLTEVRPGVDGSAGAATPEFWNKSVTLLGRTTEGRRGGLRVSTQAVESIDPLLRALAPVVARRPDLLPHHVHRSLFEEYVRDLESGPGPQRG